MKGVRAALCPLLERAQAMVTPEMQQRLHAKFGPMGPTQTKLWLHQIRPVALQLARAGTARQWQTLLEERPSEIRPLVLYAATAWITRAIVLAEHLEHRDLANLPKKWAAEQALGLLDDVESDEAWLWPFDTDSPWPDRDEE